MEAKSGGAAGFDLAAGRFEAETLPEVEVPAGELARRRRQRIVLSAVLGFGTLVLVLAVARSALREESSTSSVTTAPSRSNPIAANPPPATSPPLPTAALEVAPSMPPPATSTAAGATRPVTAPPARMGAQAPRGKRTFYRPASI
jgi:hypothetical protein